MILIATDGEPTDFDGNSDAARFKEVLQNERIPIQNVPVTIIACTGTFDRDFVDVSKKLCCSDDDASMEYLNGWDRSIPHLDVVDDFVTEREEIRKCQGASFPFSYGDVRRVLKNR